MPPPAPPSGRDRWRHRRRLVYASLIFDVVIIVASLLLAAYRGLPEALANTTITMAFTHGGGVLGAYVFGAAWDDRNKREEQE